MDPRIAYRYYVSTHFFEGEKLRPEFFDLQRRYFQRNYLRHLPMDRTRRIVDLGCGAGHFLLFLRAEGYTNAVGVDVAPECVAECRKRELPVVEDDIVHFLQHQTAPIDTVVLNDVLEHQTKEQLFTILELVHVRLAPGGRLLVKVPNMANPFLGADSRYLDITHELGFNESSLEQALRLGGFIDVQVFPLDIYVLSGVRNAAAKTAAAFLNRLFRLISNLYGRTETTIFTKNILGVAEKPQASP